MITVNLVPLTQTDNEKLQCLGVTPTESTFHYAAKDGEKLLGSCFYTVEDDTVLIHLLETNPENDMWMMDGLVRSCVNHAFSLNAWVCRFSSQIPAAFLKQFYFDEDAADFTIQIDDLLLNHKNCGH